MTLNEKGIRIIDETICGAWEPTPAKRAARDLWVLDVSSAQLAEFRKSALGRKMDETWYTGTLNELRDLEARRN